ncbi:MAG: hypothetical protein MI725_15175, partial [Pirellulales bacterium]|nr:hypothetical protein [Pirellulales bacterium]
RRNFVVEIKSNRRQKRTHGTSIWDDTDLKAITRDVENELPAPDPRSGGANSPKKMPRVQVPDGESGATGDTNEPIPNDEQPGRVSVPRIIQALPQTAAESVAKSVQNELNRLSVLHEPSLQEPARSKQPKQQTSISTQPQVPSLAELAELEVENCRLKAIWRSQLLTENSQLRKMHANLLQVPAAGKSKSVR